MLYLIGRYFQKKKINFIKKLGFTEFQICSIKQISFINEQKKGKKAKEEKKKEWEEYLDAADEGVVNKAMAGGDNKFLEDDFM
jgi:predicted transcriptional regulator